MTILRVASNAVFPKWAKITTPTGDYEIKRTFKDGTTGPVSYVTTDRPSLIAGTVYLRFLPPETPNLVKPEDLEAAMEKAMRVSAARTRATLEAMEFDAENNEFSGRGNW